MNMKKILTITGVLFLTTVFLSSTAFAGSTQRHRWEGVAIGVGVALLGTALIHSHKAPPPPEPAPAPRVGRHYRPPKPEKRHGYWEIREVWVPPTYRKVWNPAHYDRHGHWVDGHWIEIIDKEGYWTREKVWISRR